MELVWEGDPEELPDADIECELDAESEGCELCESVDEGLEESELDGEIEYHEQLAD